jgi:hypothetical protein
MFITDTQLGWVCILMLASGFLSGARFGWWLAREACREQV